jgi:esterase/lipase superfamily enzyme
LDDFRSTAAGIVERALRATAEGLELGEGSGWEVPNLGKFLSSREDLDHFLQHLFDEVSKSGGDPNHLKFLLEHDTLGLLQSPVSLLIRFVQDNLRNNDYARRLKAGDPDAIAGRVKEFTRLFMSIEEQKDDPDAARKRQETRLRLGLDARTLVRVFYATDRMQMPKWKGKTQYKELRSLLGRLHYGECEISIPKGHRTGRLETPSILRLEFDPDPKKHIVPAETRSLEERAFLQEIASSISKSTARDAFVFVHGYNVSFEDAARRTGQIAFDLDFVGAPIFYSWPSNGKAADYLKDETNIAWSAPHFERFLALLSKHSGAARIHIIAHSMGNRVVCDALKALSHQPNVGLRFNHLVLAAPDIDADTFQELAATLQKLSGRITLYESSQDKAIRASKKIHGYPRAGEPLLVIPGLDTIDASAIDTDFLGHSYFSDNWPLLSDIHSILLRDEPPSRRFGLVGRRHKNGIYYAFRT